MKEGKVFDAMEMFEQVKTPPGMYNLAQVLTIIIIIIIMTLFNQRLFHKLECFPCVVCK